MTPKGSGPTGWGSTDLVGDLLFAKVIEGAQHPQHRDSGGQVFSMRDTVHYQKLPSYPLALAPQGQTLPVSVVARTPLAMPTLSWYLGSTFQRSRPHTTCQVGSPLPDVIMSTAGPKWDTSILPGTLVLLHARKRVLMWPQPPPWQLYVMVVVLTAAGNDMPHVPENRLGQCGRILLQVTLIPFSLQTAAAGSEMSPKGPTCGANEKWLNLQEARLA